MSRIWLYSLIAVAVLVVGALAFGISGALNSGEEPRVGQVNAPTAEEPTAPETVSENDRERDWREIAEQRGEGTTEEPPEDQALEDAEPAAPTDAALNLTVPSAGIENNPVTDSVEEDVLANGAGKIPSTGFPWQDGSNTYIAAHVYGYPGTGSWQQFAGVPNMAMGDQIFLTDSNGTVYEYEVNEIITVEPTDVWVVEPTGQTTVSLQTCVGPDWSQRLVVRGALVGTSQA